MKFITFLLLLSSLLFSQNFSLNHHFMFIDDKGVLKNAYGEKIGNHEFYIRTILQQIKAYQTKDTNLSLTLYIHGGLNSFKDAKNRTRDVSKKMLKEGQYPIFIAWEAEPIQNYLDHLFLLRNGERNPKKALPSSPFVLMEDMFQSIRRSPLTSWNTLFGQNRFSLLREDKSIAKKIEHTLNNKKEFQLHLKEAKNQEDFLDYSTFLNPMKLMTAPMIDGLGDGAWDSMLRRTDLILNAQSGFNGLGGMGSKTAVYTLLNRLEKKYPDLKINLIAHSMGTIIADNILTRFPDNHYKNIVYMASASSLKNVEKSIVPWLKKSSSHQFYNLTLHPYNDMGENRYLDFVPRGSILIWIDEFLEEIHSFGDKRAGFWYNIIRSAEVIFPKEVRHQVHLTRFGIDDNSPQEHQDFDAFAFWRESFWRYKMQ